MITRKQHMEDYIRRMESNRRYLTISYLEAKATIDANTTGEDMTEVLASLDYTKQVLIDFAHDMDLLMFVRNNFEKLESPTISNSTILSMKKVAPVEFVEPTIVEKDIVPEPVKEVVPEPVLEVKAKKAKKEVVPEPVLEVKAKKLKKKA